jgi:hypothetical protein
MTCFAPTNSLAAAPAAVGDRRIFFFFLFSLVVSHFSAQICVSSGYKP